MFEFHLSKGLKNKKVRLKKYQNIEPQEVFLDNLAKKEESKLGISERKFEVLLSHRMMRIFRFFSILIIIGLFSKTFQYQIFEQKQLSAKAKENKFINKSLETARGVIYDSKGEQLVFNKSSFNLVLDKNKLPELIRERQNIFKTISKIINLEVGEIEKQINNSKDPIVLIKENLDNQSLIILNTKIDSLPGFEIQRSTLREYKDGNFFSHIIGYTSRIKSEELKENGEFYSPFDYVGREGLEKSYEKFLRRNPGKLQIEKDVFGNIKSKEVILLPESGGNLVLWIDSALQKKIIEELLKTLENIGGKKAAAVAINPKNGGVLALVSIPAYDNNLFAKTIDKEKLKALLEDPLNPLYNRAIAGQYAVGSTIKPLIASAALQENLINPGKEINCKGEITIPHRYNPNIVYEFKDWTVHGITNIRKAIAESCNVYFYTIGGGYKDQKGLGPSRIKKYLELFGWGSKTSIDLPGENSGFIPWPDWKKQTKKENWWDGDTYNLSIGQGDIKITPIEVATAFQAIANGGTIYQPQLVQKIIDNDKKEIEKFSPVILNKNFIDPNNLQIVREGMRLAVTGEGAPHASSVLLNSLPVSSAAKTGTAQTSTKNHYHNWITVFAPYENPEIVLTIILENVPTQAATLLPAKNILEWYFSNK